MKKAYRSALLILLPVAAFALPCVEETMTLAKGWNAIYLESTPTNAACADFFAGAPVARVASYQSDAYSSTRQIADDGTEATVKPQVCWSSSFYSFLSFSIPHAKSTKFAKQPSNQNFAHFANLA